MGVVGGGGAEVGEGVAVGVGVVAGAGDGAEKEPLAFKGGRVSLAFEERSLSFGSFESGLLFLHGLGSWGEVCFLCASLEGSRARCAGGFGERACAVRRWGWLRSGRTLRGAAGAGKRKVSGRSPLLRYALPAGAPDPRARCYHLQNIWGSTLGTVALEGVASRVRRAPIAAQGKPLCLMRLAHDAGRPARGAHAVRAVQLSHARLIQECAPRGRELLSPRGPRGSAGWTPPGTWSRALKTGGSRISVEKQRFDVRCSIPHPTPNPTTLIPH